MKKSLLFVLAMLVGFMAYSQQVERQQVVQEIGTGVWCVYCPGAAMGADDLLNSGADIAVIKYHSGDIYANSYSSARISFYGMTGYPTSKMDGTVTTVGGNPSQSMYSTYLPLYNFRKGIPTSFTLSFDATTTGNQTNVAVTVNKVFAYSGTNLVVHLVVTETYIPHNWFNQQYVKNVTRLMVPNQSGTPVNFSSSNTQTVNLNFTLNTAWVKENVELIAFIQDMSSKEILQAGKIMLAEFSVADKQAEPETCPDSPITFTGQDKYNTSQWTWNFPGGYPESSSDPEVEIIYETPGVYDVTLTISDGINSHTMVKQNYVTVIDYPDAPQMPTGPETVDILYVVMSEYETEPIPDAVSYTWMLMPEEAGIIEGAGNTATVTWNQDFLGEAYISVKMHGQMCESLFSEELEVMVGTSVGIADRSTQNEIQVFPNPANGFINVSIPNAMLNDVVDLRLYDLSGSIVYQSNGAIPASTQRIDLSHLPNGVYILMVNGVEQVKSYKINLINR